MVHSPFAVPATAYEASAPPSRHQAYAHPWSVTRTSAEYVLPRWGLFSNIGELQSL